MHVQNFLAQHQVPFRELTHPYAFQAARVAEALHATESNFAKPVVVMVDNEPVLAVVPANSYVNLRRLKRTLRAHDVRLATEAQCQRLFPECEPGAWPPFGSLHHIPTILDDGLALGRQMVFESDDHQHAIEMNIRDFEAIEQPRHMRIATLKRSWRDGDYDWGTPI